MELNKKWTESQLDDYQLKNAQSALITASKQNEELSQESRQLYDVYYDKILLYSAGAFSFSVALISLVVGDKITALSKTGFILPNIYWLYFSLFLFLATCILVLFSRKFDAAYTAQFGMHNYCKKKREEQKALLNKLQNYPGEVLVPQSNRQTEINKCKQNINRLEIGIKENLALRNRSYNFKVLCQKTCEIAAFSATVFLLLFTIQLTQEMIWG